MAEIQEGDLIDQGALPPDDFHDNVERIQEVANYEVEVPLDILKRLEKEAANLLVDQETLSAAATALSVGHLVLQGPPGTGKSSLARALCRAFHSTLLPVTAHEDWSTFEVIGRQELRVNTQGQEEVIPVNGFFTEAAIRCAGAIVRHSDDPAEPQATWLLIDELNRAHLDKAFGELFTVLGSDEPVSITLPHQKTGNRELVTPRRFRVVATLNSVDRQFVNSLSQGLRRRFTFITVSIPPPLDKGKTWTDNTSLASREFAVVTNRAIARIVTRTNFEDEDNLQLRQEELVHLLSRANQILEKFFHLIAQVRYAGKGSRIPHLPIGTAQLIDTIELFLSRIYVEKLSEDHFLNIMDWAVSIKIVPLFDADTIDPTHLEYFADQLENPFNNLTRRELMQIVAAGLYYVE